MLQSLASSSCVRLMQNHKSTWYFASLLLGYVLYLVFGAIIFSSVELPYEDLLRQELRAVKQRFLQENECLSEERLERFLKTALDASSYGVSILNNASVNWNWDFTSSLFFASTVLSTTGECGLGWGGRCSLSGAQKGDHLCSPGPQKRTILCRTIGKPAEKTNTTICTVAEFKICFKEKGGDVNKPVSILPWNTYGIKRVVVNDKTDFFFFFSIDFSQTH